jgi:hypothetical protein
MPAAAEPIALEGLRVESDRRLVRLLLLTILFPVAFFAGLDLLGILPGETSIESRVLTRVLTVAVPVMGLWLTGGADTRRALSRGIFITALASVAVLVALQLQRPRGTNLLLAPMLMILAIMYVSVPNTVTRQVLPPLLLSAFLIAARVVWLNGPSDAGMAADIVVLLFVNFAGVLAVRRRVALQDLVSQSWRQEAEARVGEREAEQRATRAAQDLRALRGIIPICASCKHVRTDVGEWQQIERYVQEHSEAQFSHGVCPDCAEKLYGDFVTEYPETPSIK